MPRHPPCALISLTFSVNVFYIHQSGYQQTFHLPLPELCFPQRLKVIFQIRKNCSFRNFHFLLKALENLNLPHCITFLLYSVFKVQCASAVLIHLKLSSSSRKLERTFVRMVGANGLEPSTSRLSGVCSNHLSYAPLDVRG